MKYSSLKDLRWSGSGEAEIKRNIYLTSPERLNSLQKIFEKDKSVAKDIEEAEALIACLKEYRQALYDRAQEVVRANYYLRLSLEREVRYTQNRKYYHVYLRKIFCQEDIQPEEILHERFDGAKRHEAVKRFQAMKKQYPGIECQIDIKKRSWEK